MTTTLEQAMKLADQDCPLPSLAGPALKALRARVLELEGQPAAPVGVPDDAWPRLELWFFRELSDAQRLSLLKLHGFPVDEIGESLILQKRSLRRILAAAPSATQANA